MQQRWLKVVLKLLIPKINHQELKLKEHQDKMVKEVEEAEEEVKEVEEEVKEVEEVVKEVEEVVKEVDVVEIEVAVAEAENSVAAEVERVVVVEELKVDVAVLDQEPLLPLTMKEMKFLNVLTEKDNLTQRIPMPPITVMKEDQEPAEAPEARRKTDTEKETGETSPRDNIKRRVPMVKLKSPKPPWSKSQ